MRRRIPHLLVLAFLASASAASAAGLNLSWNDCGNFGECNQAFACNTNTGGAFQLYGSFVPPPGVTQCTGEEIVVDFAANSSDFSMPSWWQFKNGGSCRQAAVSASADFTGGTGHCADYWGGQAAGAIAAWRFGDQLYPGWPNSYGRLLIVFAVPPTSSGSLDPGLEYYSFRLTVTKAKTVGTGSCSGCSIPAAFQFASIKLTQPVGVGDYQINQPLDRSFAAWQGGHFGQWDVVYSCPMPVEARNRTWGSIKSLYR